MAAGAYEGRTKMIMNDPKVEKRASVAFNFDRALVHIFGAFKVALFQFLRTLFQVIYGGNFCRVRCS
jgi:hypothetical protein